MGRRFTADHPSAKAVGCKRRHGRALKAADGKNVAAFADRNLIRFQMVDFGRFGLTLRYLIIF
jgi:hypothetical protein